MKRRSFIQTLAAIGGACVVGPDASRASSGNGAAVDGWAVLVDLSLCEGCQACELACAEANGLPEPDDVDIDEAGFRPTSDHQRVAVSRFQTSKGDVYVRRQCMHCLEPACAAGCLTKALYKQPDGPVTWNGDKCLGCRYCMISCPFDVPKFEYDSRNPRIEKCTMCWDRLKEGQQPTCVEECPAEALAFGRRSEMLRLARARLAEDDEYVPHIYGEHEAGGTGWLYISKVDFAELGFPAVDQDSYPEMSRDFLTAVPVVIGLAPMALLGLRAAGGGNDSPATGRGTSNTITEWTDSSEEA